MDKQYINLKNEDQMIETINFILQEAYRLAVIKQYPEDFSRIYNLSKNVTYNISKLLTKNAISPRVEHIIRVVLSNILEKTPISQSIDEINTLIDKWWETEYYEVEISTSDTTLKINMIETVSRLLNENKCFKCSINHKYPPLMLATNFEQDSLSEYYYSALDYIYTLKYIPQKYDYKKATQKTVYHYRPYHIHKPLREKTLYHANDKQEKISVPDNALSKNNYDDDIFIHVEPESDPEFKNLSCDDILTSMELIGPKEVDITTEITFRIDMSKPFSNTELSKLLSYIRSDIAYIQAKNKKSKICLATTTDELDTYNREEDLEEDDQIYIRRLHRAKIQDLDNAANAKDFLCALILAAMHFFNYSNKNGEATIYWGKAEKESSLQYTMGLLSDNLTQKYGKKSNIGNFGGDKKNSYNINTEDDNPNQNNKKDDYYGFSVAMIERGYKKLNKLINNYLDEFQYGRVQFDKQLNKLQRSKLDCEGNISLNQLHPDDHERASDVINQHKKMGRNASIKRLKNGSYVITW